MSSQQLSFSLRVSSSVKTVHLLGSWDNYVGQLPLSKDKSSSKSGSWKGTFKFQNSTLEPGQRYWYYYIIDGYHVAHNPSEKSTTEPTTGRDLNILDVPNGSSKHSSSSSSSRHHSSSSSHHKSSSSSKHSSSSSSRHHSSSSRDKDRDHHRSSRSSRKSLTVDIPKGRPLSTSQIKAPKPVSPTATKKILESEYRYYDDDEIADLTARFGYAVIDEDDVVTNFSNSPMSSSGSSLSSYESDSSAGSPSSSLSGYSTPGSDLSSCTCERYGITRKGERVKIDCRGQYCGYEDSSDCSSEGGYDDRYDSPVSHGSSRRNGIVVT
jgi:hypothetical protein